MIYQLKVNLTGAKPPIWRRLHVDSRMTFYQLHHVLQIAFDWFDFHLHVFEFGSIPEEKKGRRKTGEFVFDLFSYDREEAYIGNPEHDDGSAPFFDEKEERLCDWLRSEKDFCTYIYDFGDYWRHRIVLEKRLEPEEGAVYPVCVKANRRAPEENSGGIFDDEAPASNPEENARLLDRINQQLHAEKNLFRVTESEKEAGKGSSRNQENDGESDPDLWRELLEQAKEFHKLRPWERLSDNDIFAVYDAMTEETGYCCVLGQAGEVFGLAVYLGEQGRRNIVDLMSPGFEDVAYYEQNALLLSFEDREELEKEDYQLVKETGVRFRGRNAWPVFRSYEPGYVPWPLNDEEAAFMNRVLEQALDVCRKFQDQPEMLGLHDNNVFARLSQFRGEHLEWRDGSLEFSLENMRSDKPEPPLLIHEWDLAQLRKRFSADRNLVLEYDVFDSPGPVLSEKGTEARPFFPVIGLYVEKKTGLVVGHDLGHPANFMEHFQQSFVKLITHLRRIPGTIRIRNERAEMVLRKPCQKLGISLRKVSALPVAEQVKDEMMSGFFGV